MRPLPLSRITTMRRLAVTVATAIALVLAVESAQAGWTHYDKVSQVLMSVYSSGARSPSSPAVKHATDVDMPSRGGTPQELKKYLMKPDVHKWYCDNFQLK